MMIAFKSNIEVFMIKEIVKDDFFLALKSSTATKDDLTIVQDLKDTLSFHREKCVGMAANMIGYSKRIIAFLDGEKMEVMLNPEILKYGDKQYDAKEGCLSHVGVKPCRRYEKSK